MDPLGMKNTITEMRIVQNEQSRHCGRKKITVLKDSAIEKPKQMQKRCMWGNLRKDIRASVTWDIMRKSNIYVIGGPKSEMKGLEMYFMKKIEQMFKIQ